MTDTPSSPAPPSTPVGTADQPATLTADAGLKPAAGCAHDVVAQAHADVNRWNAEDHLDRLHSEQATNTLRSAFGDEFLPVLRVVSAYEKNLSDSERDKLYTPGQGNRLPLNDPAEVVKLAQKALDNIPPLKAAVAQYGDEKSAIEAMMGDRRSAYWKGPHAEALQLKYRMLMRG